MPSRKETDHMSNITPLLERNKEFARSGAHVGLTPVPKYKIFVVTCMDGRVDPAHILGVNPGDALVMRNAGGRVTDEVIREVAFIATLTETLFGDAAPPFEVAVIHHTSCGSGFLADPDFRHTFAERIHADEDSLADEAVTDPSATVPIDVDKLTSSSLLPAQWSVSGHIYDVDTGLVSTVPPTNAAGYGHPDGKEA
jgi:carbonic anhydrase